MKRVIVAILVAVLVTVLITPAVLAKPDMNKPLPATDVQLVKKATLHGKPGGGGGGKPVKQAAKGVLGDQLGAGASKYAIIIGISDYPGTINDLQYCDDDAEDMYDALTTLYGYSPSDIHLLLNMSASFAAIKGAIDDIESQAVAGDEVVFFFSGHGANGRFSGDNAQDKQQRVDSNGIDEAIVCHDGSQTGNLLFIWDGQLRDWFAGFDTSRIIFIFDSCLAGGMTDLAASGRVINMACSETGVSYEDSSWGGGHGQFTYYFVDQGMLGSKADTYDNVAGMADVTVEEAFDYAKANCRWQTPAISDSFSNDLLL
jgi:hypothetical protein